MQEVLDLFSLVPRYWFCPDSFGYLLIILLFALLHTSAEDPGAFWTCGGSVCVVVGPGSVEREWLKLGPIFSSI